ncbi:TetR family transcriptional regulator [Ketogulonicigenium robustum]|uniref:TetR family transcriptional regulator n=1 Tax=Ketogulonicigenium robustum TaxID=92947 RepID=A0A1W6NZG6_9RHOB|nr:TetR/AcrR family transcriptional regulator [Ketogulonicigenium robustum]ARO14480.1 TetR family transcriptional regulator [Ketogulonicigenium robustum]
MSARPPLSSRGAARQEALIAAATELFLAKGFANVTIDEVVAVAGGSKTSVYRQFGGKEGLFAEVVTQLCATLLSPLAHLDLGGATPAVGLDILARTLMRQLLQPRHIAFQRMVLAVSDQFPALMAKWYDVGPRQSQAMIARFLGDDAQARRLAIFFHDMIVTDAVNSAMMGQDPAWPDVEVMIADAVRLVVCALADRYSVT